MTRITLTPEIEAWAEAEVAAGRADSVSAVVVGVLQRHRDEIEGLRAKLEEGRRSGFVDGDVALAEMDRWVAEDEAADAA